MSAIHKLNEQIWPLVHKEKWRDAALIVNDQCQLGLKLETDNPAKTLPVLQHWLHFLLNSPGGTFEAARLLWTPNQFSPEPECTKQVWQLFDEAAFGLLMGGASMSKSFSMGVRIFLEWIRDPQYTTVNLVGPGKEHLEKNLFSHLVGLQSSAKLPMPGTIGELWMGLDRRKGEGAIHGVVIPKGQVRKAAKLQGGKRMNRPEEHPIFGARCRMYVFIDEIENVPGGLWHDIDNIASQVDDEGEASGFKVFGAYNPTNRSDEVAKRAEPVKGWEAFDIEKDYRWRSKRGWEVLRLDGEKSENVIAGKKIFPGLQTRAGLERIALGAGGKNSPGYITMGRGAYPPQGIALSIIPPGMVGQMRGEFIWADRPKSVAGADLALQGGASCIYTLGDAGKASGMKLLPSIEYPEGRTVMFKNQAGEVMTRMVLQIRQQFALPKGDTMAMATKLIELNKKAGVRPEVFCCDRTGYGAGIADMIKHLWSSSIIAVCYSEGSSQTKVMQEDTKTCEEAYERMFSELWFALRYWAEFDCVKLAPQLDMSNLSQQLSNREFLTNSKGQSRAESKKDYMDRGFPSPDEADSLTLTVHAARIGLGIIPSMQGVDAAGPGSEFGDDWYGSGVHIDESNRTQTLEDQPIL